jgi:precorrin-6A/cobalt-precorrin-6A reductase
MATVLILGGTREAAALAARLLADHPQWRVITSLAGRTRAPAPVVGEVRIGGFGGAPGMAEYLRAEAVTRLIDATHPYATQISANAKLAAAQAGVPLEIRRRKPWEKQPGDRWIEVASVAEAVAAIPPGSRVFLALGSLHIAPFASRRDAFVLVRSVDPLARPLPCADCLAVVGKPGDLEAEANLLEAHAITHVVARNSGGDGAYAKIAAARKLGLPVIMIARPPSSPGS